MNNMAKQEAGRAGSLYRGPSEAAAFPGVEQYQNCATSGADRQATIPEALEQVSRSLAIQADLLSSLDNRLTPVMSMPGPSDGGKECRPEPTCQMAAVLLGFTKTIDDNSGLIREILRRLEV